MGHFLLAATVQSSAAESGYISLFIAIVPVAVVIIAIIPVSVITAVTVIILAVTPVALTIALVAAVPVAVMTGVHTRAVVTVCSVVSRTILPVLRAIAIGIPTVGIMHGAPGDGGQRKNYSTCCDGFH